MTAVIYGTRYGQSREYAQAIAEKIQAHVYSYKEVKEIPLETHLIFVGSLYAGKMTGLKELLNGLDKKVEELTLLTVGVTDPKETEVLHKIHRPILEQVERHQLTVKSMYHLQGRIRESELALSHRLLIKALRRTLNKKSTELLTQEERAMKQALLTPFETSDLSTIVENL